MRPISSFIQSTKSIKDVIKTLSSKGCKVEESKNAESIENYIDTRGKGISDEMKQIIEEERNTFF